MSPRVIAILVGLLIVVVGGMALTVKRSTGESKAQKALDAAASRNPPPAKKP
jgi:hypothetical protein